MSGMNLWTLVCINFKKNKILNPYENKKYYDNAAFTVMWL